MSTPSVVFLFGLLLLPTSCDRSQPPASQTPSEQSVPAISAPKDLQAAIDTLTQAVETLDTPTVLDGYTEDFRSGTGRSKEDLREVLASLQENNVAVKVERITLEDVQTDKATMRTQLRLRYTDTFHDLGEGEVIVTDVLRHSWRKEDSKWRIYADERVSTYREGRFGDESPNVQLDVPTKIPAETNYGVKVAVQQEVEKSYQVMLGNYPEDPEILPPPEITTDLPEDGILNVTLARNLKGLSEMVKITVIAIDPDGSWVGATTMSKFVPGIESDEQADEAQI
ncbi:MAG: nuclear transport factor 2 family protein [Candidatus Binatia bacterium]